MKTHIFASTVILACTLCASVMAMSGGTTAEQGALWHGDTTKPQEYAYDGGPHMFSLGVSILQQKREVDLGGFGAGKVDWKTSDSLGYVGFDVFPWWTLLAGVGESKLHFMGASYGGDAEWMAGTQVRLLDYFILDPIIGEEPYWLSVQAGLQFLKSSTSTDFSGDVDWHEWNGSLTFHLTSRPERYGFLHQIGIYVGPAFSTINGKQSGQDFNDSKSFGFIGGLTLNPSDNVAINLEVQDFEDTSFGASIGFHF